MSSRARKFSELPEKTTIGSNDLLVIEGVSGANSVTSRITGSNLKKQIVSGPYNDDSSANTGGIEIGQLYYTSSGDVKVRLV